MVYRQRWSEASRWPSSAMQLRSMIDELQCQLLDYRSKRIAETIARGEIHLLHDLSWRWTLSQPTMNLQIVRQEVKPDAVTGLVVADVVDRREASMHWRRWRRRPWARERVAERFERRCSYILRSRCDRGYKECCYKRQELDHTASVCKRTRRGRGLQRRCLIQTAGCLLA